MGSPGRHRRRHQVVFLVLAEMGAQAAKLSGATEKEGIQDINFYRLKHASGFEAGISDFQSREEIATSQSSRSAFGMGTVKGMRVVVRKRPINDKELGAGAFDVLSRSDDTLWVHRCDMVTRKIDKMFLYILDCETVRL